MNVERLAASNYIAGADLQNKQAKVKVSGSELKSYDDGTEKVVLSFEGKDKKLTCNKTRLKTMINLFGPDTDSWLNKEIILTAQPLSSGKFAGQWTVLILSVPEIVAQNEDEIPF